MPLQRTGQQGIIESYAQQDGLSREKDGIKYYEGYFNAEFKFVANHSNFQPGKRYKIVSETQKSLTKFTTERILKYLLLLQVQTGGILLPDRT